MKEKVNYLSQGVQPGWDRGLEKVKVNYLSQGALPSQDWSWVETQERGVRAGSSTCPAGNRA